ncbi:MAG TPA: energy transducer TonB [Longimicrobiaceae bacterium]|jgi:TonB family protein
MSIRRTASLVFAGALASLAAGCASAGGATSGPRSAACASVSIPDSASLAAAFDSLHALRLQGRSGGELALVPHDSKPQLANPREVRKLFMRLYPPALRDAGVGGTTEVTLLIDASGIPRDVRVVRGSGHPELDRATIDVQKGMRYRPARQGSCPVPFFMVMLHNWVVEADR